MSGKHFHMKLVFSDYLSPTQLLISMSHNFPVSDLLWGL